MFCLFVFLKLDGLFTHFRVLGILCKFLVAIFSQLFLGSFMDFVVVVAAAVAVSTLFPRTGCFNFHKL